MSRTNHKLQKGQKENNCFCKSHIYSIFILNDSTDYTNIKNFMKLLPNSCICLKLQCFVNKNERKVFTQRLCGNNHLLRQSKYSKMKHLDAKYVQVVCCVVLESCENNNNFADLGMKNM